MLLEHNLQSVVEELLRGYNMTRAHVTLEYYLSTCNRPLFEYMPKRALLEHMLHNVTKELLG